jgi:hypothetical protein
VRPYNLLPNSPKIRGTNKLTASSVHKAHPAIFSAFPCQKI